MDLKGILGSLILFHKNHIKPFLRNCTLSMSHPTLYAIELEGLNVFLHVSLSKDTVHLFQECSVMFDFVKKNPPVRVLNEIELEDPLKIDYYVKYFMRHYGILHVRGGNYADEVLSKEKMSGLTSEIGKTYSDYKRDLQLYEEVVSKYQDMSSQYHNVKLDASGEIDRLNVRRNQHEGKIKLFELLPLDSYTNIALDIEWLREEMTNMRAIHDVPVDTLQKLCKNIFKFPSFTMNTSSEAVKYNIIVENLKSLVHTYYSLSEENLAPYLDAGLRNRIRSIEENRVESTVLLRNPRFTLDNVFLHPYCIKDWAIYLEAVNDTLDKMSTIAYTVTNIFDEIKYDLSTFSEKKNNYSIRYVAMLAA